MQVRKCMKAKTTRIIWEVERLNASGRVTQTGWRDVGMDKKPKPDEMDEFIDKWIPEVLLPELREALLPDTDNDDFVKMAVSLPIKKENFVAKLQEDFKESIAKACNCDKSHVTLEITENKEVFDGINGSESRCGVPRQEKAEQTKKAQALGLKWIEAGSEKPSTGKEIKNELLAAALQKKVEFKKEEWEKFLVADLSSDSYIKASNRYFKPEEVEESEMIRKIAKEYYASKHGAEEIRVDVKVVAENRKLAAIMNDLSNSMSFPEGKEGPQQKVLKLTTTSLSDAKILEEPTAPKKSTSSVTKLKWNRVIISSLETQAIAEDEGFTKKDVQAVIYDFTTRRLNEVFNEVHKNCREREKWSYDDSKNEVEYKGMWYPTVTENSMNILISDLNDGLYLLKTILPDADTEDLKELFSRVKYVLQTPVNKGIEDFMNLASSLQTKQAEMFYEKGWEPGKRLEMLSTLQEDVPMHLRGKYVAERKMRESMFGKSLKIYAYDPNSHNIKWDFAGVYCMKVVRPHIDRGDESKFSDSDERKKIEIEVDFAMKLNTEKNMVTCYSVDMAPDYSRFSMLFGYKEGFTLRDLIRAGISFTQSEVVEIACDVLDGLDAIHKLGAIHRDIGTASIIQVNDGKMERKYCLIFDSEFVVSQDKHRKETDFAYQALETAITGINIKERKTESQAQSAATNTEAKLAEQIKKLIQDQQAEPELMQKLDEFLNTACGNTQNSMNIRAPASISQNGSTEEKKIWLPENMAPELWPHLNITNKLDPPDHRTDLWSVGVLIFRMMAGQLPFTVQEKDMEDVQDFFSREEVLKMQALICNFKEPCPNLLDVMSSSNQNRDRFEDSKVASQNRIFCELIMTFLQKSPKHRPSSALQMKAKLKEVHLQCEMSATQHDIFISYRQASDSTFAKMLYHSLNNSRTKSGRLVKVFLDQYDLKKGKEWETAFARGLFKSKIYMPICSAGFTGPMSGRDFPQKYKDAMRKNPNVTFGNSPRLNNFRHDGYYRIVSPLLSGLYAVANSLGIPVPTEHDHQDNCLLEVQLALRLLKIKQKYKKTAQVLGTDSNWSYRCWPWGHSSNKVADSKSPESSCDLKFGDLQMILPLLLGRLPEKKDGNLGNFFAPGCYMLYGKLPIGVSKMTSEKCREHLRKLILKYSLPRQENDQKSADSAPAPLAVMPNSNAREVCQSDQRQDDTTSMNTSEKQHDFAVALHVESTALSMLQHASRIFWHRPEDSPGFPQKIVEEVRKREQFQCVNGQDQAAWQVLHFIRGQQGTPSRVILVCSGDDKDRLQQALPWELKHINAKVSNVEVLGSIERVVTAALAKKLYDGKARKPYFVKMTVSLPMKKTAFNEKMQEKFKESIKNANSEKIQLALSDINLDIISIQKKIRVEVTIFANQESANEIEKSLKKVKDELAKVDFFNEAKILEEAKTSSSIGEEEEQRSKLLKKAVDYLINSDTSWADGRCGLSNQKLWGVKATFDALLTNQGIFVGQSSSTGDDDWQKTLQKLKHDRKKNQNQVDKDQDQESEIVKNLTVSDRAINPEQESKLRTAIADMKNDILTQVDLAYEKFEREGHSHLLIESKSAYLKLFIIILLLFIFLFVVIAAITWWNRGWDMLCPMFKYPEFQGPGCGTRICNSCSDWRDSEQRSCKDYALAPMLCDRPDLTGLQTFRNRDGIDARDVCCECNTDIKDQKRKKDMCVFRQSEVSTVSANWSTPLSKPVGVAFLTSDIQNLIYVIADAEARTILIASSTKQEILVGSTRKDPSPQHSKMYVGTNAIFTEPWGLCVSTASSNRRDLAATIYVSDSGSHEIRVIRLKAFPLSSASSNAEGFDLSRASSNAEVTTLAGGTKGYQDGIGTEIRFSEPKGLAITPDGSTLIVADSANHVLRVIDITTSQSRTLAGKVGEYGYFNGPALSSTFSRPVDVSLDPTGPKSALLVVADSWNHVVRAVRISVVSGQWRAETVRTLAGVEGSPGFIDGQSSIARFQNPAGVCIVNGTASQESGPVVLVSDTFNGKMRMIRADYVTTVAKKARFGNPWSMSLMSNKDEDEVRVVVADSVQRQIRQINLTIPNASQTENITALLLIDVQDCFLDKDTGSGQKGTLPVTNSATIIPVINDMRQKNCNFKMVAKTVDFHPPKHISFASTHNVTPFYNFPLGIPLMCTRTTSGRIADSSCCPRLNISSGMPECPAPAFGCPSHGPASNTSENPACRICQASPELCFPMSQAMWPDHCVQDVDGQIRAGVPEVVVQLAKYPYIDAYSAFMDNAKQVKTELDAILRSNSISTLYIAGLATDYTVKNSAIDAIALGYKVKLLTDAVQGITPEGSSAALTELRRIGVEMITTQEIPPCISSFPTSSARRASPVSALPTVLLVGMITSKLWQ